MDHRFTGPAFTVGIEEELMLVDPGTLDLAQGIESILSDPGAGGVGEIKPELMQAVLEIATEPCPNLEEAAAQLADLRTRVREAAARHGMLLAASGTHPTARGEDQLITARPRYRELAAELGWIALQELIFGTHVHVGVDGADKAIYIADGVRRHIPLMLAVSSNSPLWRGHATQMMSARTPAFRAFPRVGVPPHYGTWEIFSGRVELMMRSGAIPDYTYLWWDVRPHPNLGTVEIRVYDQQTRLGDTVALAALGICLVHRYASNFEASEPLIEVPTELIDDNKVRASLHGIEGELVDFPRHHRAPAADLAREMVAELARDAEALGCEEALGAVEGIIEAGTGARRQLGVLESGAGVDGLVRYLCEESADY
ncbi:MAG: YbdK family carboxylate-amine ligase [Solirubrobacterales bacterium]